MTLHDLVQQQAARLQAAGLFFGHGTDNAFDEAAWLLLWALGLPLDSDLAQAVSLAPAPPDRPQTAQDSESILVLGPDQQQKIAHIFEERIRSRKPAAYLTREAWLQGVPFYVDERSIVPRSLIAELLVQADSASDIDPWLPASTRRVLDLCTGNGSLAVLAALVFPEIEVDAADLSTDALAVAAINLQRHGLSERVRLLHSDGLAAVQGPYDLLLCNPPYVNADSMSSLPAEYLAEPEMALAGGADGMDFVRQLLREAPSVLSEQAVLILEIGNERPHFEAAFPGLDAVWLTTSAGDDQVLLLTRQALAAASF